MGAPSAARWARIWCVRPVCGRARASARSVFPPSRRSSVLASRPCRPVRHRPGREGSRARRSVHSTEGGNAGPVTARYCLPTLPSRKLRARAEVAGVDLPKTVTPVVSRSRRCTRPAGAPRWADVWSRRLGAPPGVGWAGSPAGLSTTSTLRSSKRIRSGGAGAGSLKAERPDSSRTTSTTVPEGKRSPEDVVRRPRTKTAPRWSRRCASFSGSPSSSARASRRTAGEASRKLRRFIGAS